MFPVVSDSWSLTLDCNCYLPRSLDRPPKAVHTPWLTERLCGVSLHAWSPTRTVSAHSWSCSLLLTALPTSPGRSRYPCPTTLVTSSPTTLKTSAQETALLSYLWASVSFLIHDQYVFQSRRNHFYTYGRTCRSFLTPIDSCLTDPCANSQAAEPGRHFPGAVLPSPLSLPTRMTGDAPFTDPMRPNQRPPTFSGSVPTLVSVRPRAQ